MGNLSRECTWVDALVELISSYERRTKLLGWDWGRGRNIWNSHLGRWRENEFWKCSVTAWRRQWHPAPELLPGESHGWRSLVACSPSGCYQSDMTERLHFHFSLSHIGEGNGNPLQYSCLENPRDGGAWWAAVYGVAQGRTRLKWLSSSSSSSSVTAQQHWERGTDDTGP